VKTQLRNAEASPSNEGSELATFNHVSEDKSSPKHGSLARR
jgi:hypothetical protein